MNTNFHNKHHYTKKQTEDLIVSYGLILFYPSLNESSNELEQCFFLIQKRRDTFAYIEFVRGMWKNVEQLKTQISSMSIHERKRIREYLFRELWDDLFVDKSSKMYSEGYSRAKKKYDSIKLMIPILLDSTKTIVGDTSWGFPKGKKNNYQESDTECALRETLEETRFSSDNINVISPLIMYQEKYKGTNGKLYATYYFLAKTNSLDIPSKLVTNDCIRKETASDEATELLWITHPDASIYLDEDKYRLLHKALKDVSKIYKI